MIRARIRPRSIKRRASSRKPQTQLVLDQITLKRQQELRARNVISPQDLDTAQATVNSDEAKVQSAEAAVAAAQVNLDYCNIRSPINGRAGLAACRYWEYSH